MENKKEMKRGIGPSESIVIMYLSKRKSPVELYLEKTGEVEEKEYEETEWSQGLKKLLAEEFKRKTGLPVRYDQRIARHPEHKFMVGVADYLTEEDGKEGGLDIRQVSEHRGKEFEDGKVPMDYYVRIQHNLAVFGWDFAYQVVLLGGYAVLIRRVERDEIMINEIIKAERRFWEHVEKRQMVPMDGSKAATEWLNRHFANVEKEPEISLPGESLSLLEELEYVKVQEKELKEKKAELENQLKFFLGENTVGRIGNRLVKWVPVEMTKLDQKALKADHPELVEKYMTKQMYRRFSFK